MEKDLNKRLEYAMTMPPVNVTKRIFIFPQPKGGFLPLKSFKKTPFEYKGNKALNPEINIFPGLVGLASDYLTRIVTGSDPEKVFNVALTGALFLDKGDQCHGYVKSIKGLDDESIVAAVRASAFDTAYRAGPGTYKPAENINPDEKTIENIRIIVNRALRFLEEYGPKTRDGLTFEGGGYDNKFIHSGDGDFMTKDTVWEFKTTKTPPTSNHTLQILVYYLMGLRSEYKSDYKKVKSLGIFNPRLNMIWTINVKDIDPRVIDAVNDQVIGFRD